MRVPIRSRRLLALLAAASLSGCFATTPRVAVLEPTTVRPEPTTATAAAAAAARAPLANGAIYHPSSHRGLFEDRRARLVGDLLTIQIQEKTTARSSSNSSVDRKGSVDGSISRLPFVPQTSSLMPKLGVAGESSNTFEGKGATGSENLFTGTITVTVVEVLPNGNLVVSGEKQVAINQGQEYIRFSGVVNPNTITAANTVTSSQVADARLEYKASGQLDEAQVMGWLARFFLTFLPF